MLLSMSVVMGVEQAPTLSNEVPSDGSTLWDMPSTTFNITITDVDTNFNWSIDTSPDVGNSSSFNATNGSKTCALSGLAYSTTYTVTVNATSFNESSTVEETYTFTTKVAKLRENENLNFAEKGLVGVVGIFIIIGVIYVIIYSPKNKDVPIAQLLIAIMIAVIFLIIIFSVL